VRLGWTIAWLLSAAVPASSQEVSVALTLPEVLERVDRLSPELLSAREGAAAQHARAEAAAKGAGPRIGLAADWSYTDNPARVFMGRLNSGAFTAQDFGIDRLNDPDSLSHLTTVAALEVPIDAFDKVSSRAEGERASARALDARAREARQDLRLRAVEAFEAARLAGAAVRVAERATEGARAREAEVSARVEEGASLGADRLRARARRRQREADLAVAREQARIARAALAHAVGASAGEAVEPAGEPAAVRELEGALAFWQARALAERAALAAAAEERAAADHALRAEQRAAWPDLGAWAQVADDRGPSASGQSYALGASVRWSVFDPSRGRRTAAAQAAAQAAASAARAAADRVRLEVETAWRRAAAARERHAAAQGGAEEGREALRVVEERRREGLATLTDELETEAAALAAELEELAAAAAIARADAALLRAAGRL
jgi:outer membrane protein TolC